jgi:hypothetical protein
MPQDSTKRALNYIEENTPQAVWFKELFGERLMDILIATDKIVEENGVLKLKETK